MADVPGFTRLTERDENLLAVLALTRYLTAPQVHRLFFDGARLWPTYRRLEKLSHPKGQPPFLEALEYRTYKGKKLHVWKPTPYALDAAASKTSQIRELPLHDVGAVHLEHAVQMNELFVGLWRTPGRPTKARHPALRWIPSDALKLGYGEWEVQHGRTQERFIRPDAALEMPLAKKRFFLECEMGTHPIVAKGPNKPDATLHKVARYQKYFSGPNGMRGEASHYASQYADGFAAQVLFLVRTASRAKSVNAALQEWREQEAEPAAMVAVTFEEATAQLRAMAGLPALPTAQETKSNVERSAQSARPSTASLSADEVKLVWRYLYDAHASIHGARNEFRKLGREDLPPYPKDQDALVALVERLRTSAAK